MPVLIVIGYGPGNGHAIAHRFGREGWSIALVGRRAERLQAGVAQLEATGVAAHAFVGDAGDPDSLRATLRAIRADLGPVSAVALTAYRNVVVDDVLIADPETVAHVFDIGVAGLLAAVQTTLDDLRTASGAVLVVNGALGLHDDAIDGYAVSFGGDGVALECSAKTKLVGLLAARLRPEGVYVGEVVINGSVQGSPHAGPTAIDPAEIAERLWRMAAERVETHVHIAEQRP
ncbi:SDR family NAD(P)-dependent oxidoreductase [Leifsonia sp. ZF2019]|uniref:SDR family NAD(P)-dependent oxidoreductase n=1 Tax=Leifsonia sp. ZF2019 TaxID=2781978 RepID=UPI001CBD43F9|nr:SDR family NAD(P)-dependent oxidoreductase [Leifsonia sp. ZF2019]UAJ78968.1 SDR family NAD(P)-dependent oxidoreductase [Leifsonia sp. ZF2019]